MRSNEAPICAIPIYLPTTVRLCIYYNSRYNNTIYLRHCALQHNIMYEENFTIIIIHNILSQLGIPLKCLTFVLK